MITNIGKVIRKGRIFKKNTKKTVLIPLDHGATIGPVEGLENLPGIVDLVARGGANAVLGHMALALHGHRGYGEEIALILHLSASTCLAPEANHKVLVNTVERAIRMGADGVSVHINVGAVDEAAMISDLGLVSGLCWDWGMPLLAMMYVRGPGIEKEKEKDAELLKIATRLAFELGVDMIKTPYTSNQETFKEIVEGCHPVPVVIAGGSKGGDEEILKAIWGAIQVGGGGVSIGRGVFQHLHPDRMTAAICAIVHQGANVKEALGLLDVAIEVPDQD